MSDQSGGPDWWQSMDGKWHSPGVLADWVPPFGLPKPGKRDLRSDALRFWRWTWMFALLTGIGAVALGYNAAQVADCSGYSCDTTMDGAIFAMVAIGSFVGGMLLVLPLYGISRLLLGLAELLPESEASGDGKP